ncbi:MAG TPA: hypothetical protein P5338_11235, partial [Bacteroidales bacterium]|nr:hypothetical protein [Bacteroidales bacterium]
MQRDFTMPVYKELLMILAEAGYAFQTYSDFVTNPGPRVVVLRHDIDRKKGNALVFAEIQHARGITGSYYFRIVPESWDEDIIREVARLGHEVGYHYEDVDLVRKKKHLSGSALIEAAYSHFAIQLGRFRELVPVHTICSHGSPLSPFDNKMIWKHYSYRDLGILAEPYLDTDFSRIAYLTDTGRRWNGRAVTIRDHAGASALAFPHIRNTRQLTAAVKSKQLPD